MTVVLVFVTHGLINSFLLAFSPIRCTFWNRRECSADEAWAINWLAFGQFHVSILLASLARGARGQVILEQRLVCLVTAIMLSYLSIGVFMLEYLNKPMAAVQLLVYLGLLAVLVYHTATAPFVVPLPVQIRSSSFDHRKQLPLATVAVAILCILSSFQLYDMSFGTGRDTYQGKNEGGDSSSSSKTNIVFDSIKQAAVTQMLWVTLILFVSVLLATPPQQKLLLSGETLCLFVALILMTGSQGAQIEEAQARAGSIGTFFSMLIALIGSF